MGLRVKLEINYKEEFQLEIRLKSQKKKKRPLFVANVEQFQKQRRNIW